MIERLIKSFFLAVLAMTFICMIVVVAIFCTELDIKTAEKQIVLLQKEAAELTVEAEAKKVLYFETLNKVYTTENLVVYPGFRTIKEELK